MPSCCLKNVSGYILCIKSATTDYGSGVGQMKKPKYQLSIKKMVFIYKILKSYLCHK